MLAGRRKGWLEGECIQIPGQIQSPNNHGQRETAKAISTSPSYDEKGRADALLILHLSIRPMTRSNSQLPLAIISKSPALGFYGQEDAERNVNKMK